MRWNGWSMILASRSSEIARWAPRFVPATACTSSTITVSIAAQHLAPLRGEQQVEGLRRRDQDVGWRADHLPTLALIRVTGADADGQRRTEPRKRPPQVVFDVVVERFQRRDIEQPKTFARPRVEPVDPRQKRRQSLARAGRGLDEDVGAGGDHRPGGSCAGVGPANARVNQDRVAGVNPASESIAPGYPAASESAAR